MTPLEDFVLKHLEKPLPPEIMAMADHVRSRHPGVLAVLAYGSGLRGTSHRDTLMDYYVLTGRPADVTPNLVGQMMLSLAPPNVYYAECCVNGEKLRAKYAALPLSLFAHRMKEANPYFWARFAQPSALVYFRDDDARQKLAAAIAAALRTAYGHGLALCPQGTALDRWSAVLAETYRTELRPEGKARSADIVTRNAAYYDEAAALMADVMSRTENWAHLRFTGKLLTLARLAKAAFTFQGGADYVAWKIERHSGHHITVTDWQRRHPLLAGILLLPTLLAKRTLR
jgi:hypothetical protein